MVIFGRQLRWRRGADRLGPRRILVLELSPVRTRAVLLARVPGLRWERHAELPPLKPDADGQDLVRAINTGGLHADYLALIRDEEAEQLRLLSLPGRPGDADAIRAQVRQSFGIDDSWSVAHQLVREGTVGDKPEYAVLASAMPAKEVARLRTIAELAGCTPVSLTPAGLVIANLVRSVPKLLQPEACLGFLYLGEFSSCIMLFQGDSLVLLRQFRFGERTVVESLGSALELDYETAEKLFHSGSFDVGGNVNPVLEPWLHKLEISLDFFERRHRRTVAMLYLFGEGVRSQALESLIQAKVGRPMMHWNALEAFAPVCPVAGVPADAADYLLPFCEGLRWVARGGAHAV